MQGKASLPIPRESVWNCEKERLNDVGKKHVNEKCQNWPSSCFSSPHSRQRTSDYYYYSAEEEHEPRDTLFFDPYLGRPLKGYPPRLHQLHQGRRVSLKTSRGGGRGSGKGSRLWFPPPSRCPPPASVACAASVVSSTGCRCPCHDVCEDDCHEAELIEPLPRLSLHSDYAHQPLFFSPLPIHSRAPRPSERYVRSPHHGKEGNEYGIEEVLFRIPPTTCTPPPHHYDTQIGKEKKKKEKKEEKKFSPAFSRVRSVKRKTGSKHCSPPPSHSDEDSDLSDVAGCGRQYSSSSSSREDDDTFRSSRGSSTEAESWHPSGTEEEEENIKSKVKEIGEEKIDAGYYSPPLHYDNGQDCSFSTALRSLSSFLSTLNEKERRTEKEKEEGNDAKEENKEKKTKWANTHDYSEDASMERISVSPSVIPVRKEGEEQQTRTFPRGISSESFLLPPSSPLPTSSPPSSCQSAPSKDASGRPSPRPTPPSIFSPVAVCDSKTPHFSTSASDSNDTYKVVVVNNNNDDDEKEKEEKEKKEENEEEEEEQAGMNTIHPVEYNIVYKNKNNNAPRNESRDKHTEPGLQLVFGPSLVLDDSSLHYSQNDDGSSPIPLRKKEEKQCSPPPSSSPSFPCTTSSLLISLKLSLSPNPNIPSNLLCPTPPPPGLLSSTQSSSSPSTPSPPPASVISSSASHSSPIISESFISSPTELLSYVAKVERPVAVYPPVVEKGREECTESHEHGFPSPPSPSPSPIPPPPYTNIIDPVSTLSRSSCTANSSSNWITTTTTTVVTADISHEVVLGGAQPHKQRQEEIHTHGGENRTTSQVASDWTSFSHSSSSCHSSSLPPTPPVPLSPFPCSPEGARINILAPPETSRATTTTSCFSSSSCCSSSKQVSFTTAPANAFTSSRSSEENQAEEEMMDDGDVDHCRLISYSVEKTNISAMMRRRPARLPPPSPSPTPSPRLPPPSPSPTPSPRLPPSPTPSCPLTTEIEVIANTEVVFKRAVSPFPVHTRVASFQEGGDEDAKEDEKRLEGKGVKVGKVKRVTFHEESILQAEKTKKAMKRRRSKGRKTKKKIPQTTPHPPDVEVVVSASSSSSMGMGTMTRTTIITSAYAGNHDGDDAFCPFTTPEGFLKPHLFSKTIQHRHRRHHHRRQALLEEKHVSSHQQRRVLSDLDDEENPPPLTGLANNSTCARFPLALPATATTTVKITSKDTRSGSESSRNRSRSTRNTSMKTAITVTTGREAESSIAGPNYHKNAVPCLSSLAVLSSSAVSPPSSTSLPYSTKEEIPTLRSTTNDWTDRTGKEGGGEPYKDREEEQEQERKCSVLSRIEKERDEKEGMRSHKKEKKFSLFSVSDEEDSGGGDDVDEKRKEKKKEYKEWLSSPWREDGDNTKSLSTIDDELPHRNNSPRSSCSHHDQKKPMGEPTPFSLCSDRISSPVVPSLLPLGKEERKQEERNHEDNEPTDEREKGISPSPPLLSPLLLSPLLLSSPPLSPPPPLLSPPPTLSSSSRTATTSSAMPSENSSSQPFSPPVLLDEGPPIMNREGLSFFDGHHNNGASNRNTSPLERLVGRDTAWGVKEATELSEAVLSIKRDEKEEVEESEEEDGEYVVDTGEASSTSDSGTSFQTMATCTSAGLHRNTIFINYQYLRYEIRKEMALRFFTKWVELVEKRKRHYRKKF